MRDILDPNGYIQRDVYISKEELLAKIATLKAKGPLNKTAAILFSCIYQELKIPKYQLMVPTRERVLIGGRMVFIVLLRQLYKGKNARLGGPVSAAKLLETNHNKACHAMRMHAKEMDTSRMYRANLDAIVDRVIETLSKQ
ncbi:MAG: hypothetical protein KBB70_00830 [Candidatus Pacebacteria bacterium]|nr:hypothetical protein [Candidatus Paceibacterota bacterium]